MSQVGTDINTKYDDTSPQVFGGTASMVAIDGKWEGELSTKQEVFSIGWSNGLISLTPLQYI